jgi:hypothetical protein
MNLTEMNTEITRIRHDSQLANPRVKGVVKFHTFILLTR